METTATYSNRKAAVAADPAARVALILKYTYGLVPIVAGADKFLNVLTDWKQYLAPVITDVTGLSPATFMGVVGVIEIIAGVVVLIKPKVGSLVVAAWLVAIALNLLITGNYFDVAVRDIVMAIGAFSLWMLSDDNRA